MKKLIKFFKQESASNKQDQQNDCDLFIKQQQEESSITTIPSNYNNNSNKSLYHFNEKLYIYYGNVIHKIQHHHKIVKITSMGVNICFANDKNEIFIIQSNDGTCKQLICKDNQKNNPPINIPIKYFLAGYFHLTIILENNLIYGHGSTDDSQLGPSDNTKIETLQLINTKEIFNKNRKKYLEITNACSGTYSTILVLNNSEIWYCGKIERSERQFNFTKMEFNGFVKNISCGYAHLLVLNNKGELFGYGDNEYNQLFLEDTKPLKTLQKLELPFLNKNSYVLDAYAIRLSHLSVLITNLNEIYVFGYFSTELGSSFTQLTTTYSGRIRLNQSLFQLKGDLKEIDEVTSFEYNDPIVDDNYRKYNYLNGEISIYGGYASLFLVDNLKRNIWLGGLRGPHFTNEKFYLKEVDNDIFSELKEQVIDICCGSDCYGVLVGKVNLLNIYMLNNLKRLVDISCGIIEIEETTNQITPLSDIDVRCNNVLSWQ